MFWGEPIQVNLNIESERESYDIPYGIRATSFCLLGEINHPEALTTPVQSDSQLGKYKNPLSLGLSNA